MVLWSQVEYQIDDSIKNTNANSFLWSPKSCCLTFESGHSSARIFAWWAGRVAFNLSTFRKDGEIQHLVVWGEKIFNFARSAVVFWLYSKHRVSALNLTSTLSFIGDWGFLGVRRKLVVCRRRMDRLTRTSNQIISNERLENRVDCNNLAGIALSRTFKLSSEEQSVKGGFSSSDLSYLPLSVLSPSHTRPQTEGAFTVPTVLRFSGKVPNRTPSRLHDSI